MNRCSEKTAQTSSEDFETWHEGKSIVYPHAHIE